MELRTEAKIPREWMQIANTRSTCCDRVESPRRIFVHLTSMPSTSLLEFVTEKRYITIHSLLHKAMPFQRIATVTNDHSEEEVRQEGQPPQHNKSKQPKSQASNNLAKSTTYKQDIQALL